MAPRLELQSTLEAILGSANVYFQPPPNITMQHPCILYRLDRNDAQHADNRPYIHTKRYQVTVIDRDPDSVIPDKVADLPTAMWQSFFTTANLNHTVYTLYF